MSTDYYTLDGVHIGKRWAAGQWCWDCRVPCDCVYRNEQTGEMRS